MKAVIQRVKHSSVTVDGKLISKIDNGFMILLGVMDGDTKEDADKLIKKIPVLRIFEDENNKMNLSIQDVKGEILAVSQFTLAADLSRGNRPGFESAARPEEAKQLYEYFVEQLQTYNLPVQTGIFQADMKVALVNDGPCTFILQK